MKDIYSRVPVVAQPAIQNPRITVEWPTGEVQVYNAFDNCNHFSVEVKHPSIAEFFKIINLTTEE